MPTDPKKITESRKQEREAMQIEFRQIHALEQIADTLEAIRIEMVGLQHVLALASRQPGIR